MLRAASLPTTKVKVRALRREVADKMWEARIENKVYAGLTAHEVLVKEQMTLRAYYQETCEHMWASQLELAIAAEILGIAVNYLGDNVCMKLGEGRATHAIVKRGKHYILAKNNKKQTPRNGDVMRAGMNPWTWEAPQQLPQQMPTHAVTEEEYVTVRTSPTFRHEIRRITFIKAAMTVADLKAKLSAILKVPVSIMRILDGDDDQEIPDWTNPPALVQLEIDSPATDMVRMCVRVPSRNATFTVSIRTTTTLEELESIIGAIMGLPVQALHLTTLRNTPWLTAVGVENHMVNITIQERAGMRHDLTPTEEYIPQGEPDGDDESESQEITNMHLRDMIEAAHDGAATLRSPSRTSMRRPTTPAPMFRVSRSRSRSRGSSPAASLYRGSVSPTRHGYCSRAYPYQINQAQEEPISKVVIEEEGPPIGYIWANPMAAILEVRETLKNDLHIYVDIRIQPETATLWREVETVQFEKRPEIQALPYKDMRIDRWELYQKPRPIPVLQSGVVIRYMVFPWLLPLMLIQHRLDLWATTRHTYSVQAVDLDTYCKEGASGQSAEDNGHNERHRWTYGRESGSQDQVRICSCM